ncbi:hypothetical protein M9H77_21658 [Catharanthus roseus]|uniref:Uncharacterized protein n=1 Tax=Catharanthus roseus TaxID=4058 RepID=A0ACC0AN72_CATRO|nr:hypothetical protein M9H77_21658 [Catharanthus roseus]
MVSFLHTGGPPSRRNAHFLKQVVASLEDSSLKLLILSPKSKWSIDLVFNGWQHQLKEWNKWVHKKFPKYHLLRRKVGVHEAILCCNYEFLRNDDLIFRLAERWNQIIDLNYHPNSPLETQIIEVEIDQEKIAKGRYTLLGLTPREAIAMEIISTFCNKEEKLGIPKEQELKQMTTKRILNVQLHLSLFYKDLWLSFYKWWPLVFMNAIIITYLQLFLLHSLRPSYCIRGCPKIFYNIP